MLRQTRTYAVLELSAGAYEEIKGKLLAAGYHHALHHDRTHGLVLDMHGIAVAVELTEQQKADAEVDTLLSHAVADFHNGRRRK